MDEVETSRRPVDVRPRRRGRLGLAVATVVVLAGSVVARTLADDDDGPAGPPPGAWTLAPHTGLGAWVDVYDWTRELGGDEPAVGLDDVDAMHEAGVQTLYIQTAHNRSAATGVIERDRLLELIQRAHDHEMHVVAWYLPPLVDLDADLHRLRESAALPVSGLGVDIEAVTVTDVADRNRRLLELSRRLREGVGRDRAVAAITPSAVHLQVVNPMFWPAFPWPELAEAYDVFLPMAYWSIRKPELRSGERYVGDNLDRIRASSGDAAIPIVPVGGIANGTPPAELEGMVQAIESRDAPGGSLYDWATSTPEQWAALSPLRDRQAAPGD